MPEKKLPRGICTEACHTVTAGLAPDAAGVKVNVSEDEVSPNWLCVALFAAARAKGAADCAFVAP